MNNISNNLLNDYNLFVRSLAEKRENRIFLNSDEDKMLTVFVEMFRCAKQEFRIFAGSLCNNTTNNPAYIESLSDYIEKNGTLYVLLNSFDLEKAILSDLFKRLAYYKSIGKNIFIKTTTEEPYIIEGQNKIFVHFAVGDRESYRIETDIKVRKAVCNMNDSVQSKSLAELFDKIFAEPSSKEIDLLSIFNINLSKKN